MATMHLVSQPPKRWFAAFIALNSLAAVGGAIALATGTLGLEDEAVHRLPFHSPGFAAFALLVVVAFPLALLALVAWRGEASTAMVARACGWLLVGWIGIQFLILREYSPLQPLYGLLGLGLIARNRPSD